MPRIRRTRWTSMSPSSRSRRRLSRSTRRLLQHPLQQKHLGRLPTRQMLHRRLKYQQQPPWRRRRRQRRTPRQRRQEEAALQQTIDPIPRLLLRRLRLSHRPTLLQKTPPRPPRVKHSRLLKQQTQLRRPHLQRRARQSRRQALLRPLSKRHHPQRATPQQQHARMGR